MIILIAGGTHTGKTTLSQNLLKKYSYPYLSIDHLKMGLIRSGHCPLTPESDDASLTQYLWPITKEIIKTAIENRQNLIVEGSYIPFDYQADFSSDYLHQIQYVCLIFSEDYIHNHYDDILKHACETESRINHTGPSKQTLLEENRTNLEECKKYNLKYILIHGQYNLTWEPQNK